MNRRKFLTLVGGSVVAFPRIAQAQDPTKARRIGFLRAGAPPASFIDSFRLGLREHDLIEGRNAVIEFGIAPSVAQLEEVAARLVGLNVDVIFTSGYPSLLVASKVAGRSRSCL